MIANSRGVVALTATIDLVPTSSAPGIARRLVAELLIAWGVVRHVLDDAILLVSELVCNVVEHAGGRLTRLELWLAEASGILRVSVADDSPEHPTVIPVDRRAVRGRGMYLVDTLSRRWGIEDGDGGKRVWFELVLAG
jgi:anti-sigma regulatory factor (Ser/Thr protein kinase)